MRTNADLNRIIDKIVETNPARSDSPSLDLKEIPSRRETETTPRQFAPRLAVDSDSLASARSNRSSHPNSATARDSDRRPVRRDKNDTTDATDKIADVDVKKSPAKHRDEEAKRTQRRRQIDPTTCERDYSADEIEFMKALDDYKRGSGRMFPTCSEILEVFKSLGYVKIARSETTEKSTPRDAKPNRPATPAFLSDEENAFEFDVAPVPGVA